MKNYMTNDHRAALLLGVLLACSVHVIFAQPSGTASQLTIEPKLSADKVHAGSSFKVALVISIADGWHINSNTPSSEYLIGASLDVKQKDGFAISGVTYPKGENIKLSFSEDPIHVYEKRITIFFTVRASDNLKPGKETLKATLTAQACNDNMCLAPSKIEINIPFHVVDSKEKSKPINDNIFSSYRR